MFLKSLFGLLAALSLLATPALASEVVVEIRASEKADAPVVNRVKLYGSSHALVIGIDNYHGGWPRLSNAIKDARLVGEALQAKGFDVDFLIDPDGETLRSSLKRFYAIKGRDPEARLFVWYAGHGHTELGEGYLVPADAPLPSDPEFLFTALHMRDVGAMVRIARAKHALAVFDSCFAGTVFTSSRSRPPAAITNAVVRPVRQFLTSGDAEQEVSDDGTFRKLFIAALRGEEAADLNQDGYLTGTEMGLYLEDRVTNLTRAVQTPRSGKLRDQRFDGGDFVFLLPQPETQVAALPKAEPVTTQKADDSIFELAFWDAIKTSQNAADYEAYLESYPQGKFAPLAKVRARALKAERGEPVQQAAIQPAPAAVPAAPAPEPEPKADPAVKPSGENLASLPPAGETPYQDKAAVTAYVEDNKYSLERRLKKYNDRHKIVVPSDIWGIPRAVIHDYEVVSLSGKDVEMDITYEIQSSGDFRNSSHNRVRFRLKWDSDDLEFTGHE